MRTITIQADPAMGDQWLVHTIVAMPVTPDNGFIFDDDGAFQLTSTVARKASGP